MSRAAFYDALNESSYLTGLGIKDDPDNPTLVINYQADERPSNTGPFIILRFLSTPPPRNQDPDVIINVAEPVVVWAHWPAEKNTDFNDLIKILDEVDSIARTVRDRAGSDGRTLSFVQIGGRSDDITDEGFQTITKTATYQLYSRKS